MNARNYNARIANKLNLKPDQISAVIALLDDGNTLPFIARYRKEATGSLDEQQLRAVGTELTRLRKVDDRRDTILAAIEEQGKLTPQLRASLDEADSLTELEDLYIPYKRKRRTRATMAEEKGLAPLADRIAAQPRDGQSPADHARPFVSGEIPDIEAALSGARDILAERISEHPDVRRAVREQATNHGTLTAAKIKKADDPRDTYKSYYEYQSRVSRIRPHQTLAINRGEAEKILRVKLELDERDWLRPMEAVFVPDRRSPMHEQLELTMADAAKRLLLPSVERDVRRALTEEAEAHAISVFANNLRGLLNTPPLTGQTILGLDPAYRTGCKVAVIDPTGKSLTTTTIYPHPPQKQWAAALTTIERLVGQYGVTLIAIGNGTASRETEQLAAELTRGRDDVKYLIVNEAGASVYSASELARDELPDLDVTLRGAVSIARRVQDPLAELVKIDPKSVGVGLYQHDVNQTALGEAAEAVVESVVNRVGVEVNTASRALLGYVAGIGPKLAESIVTHRDQSGTFHTRAALLDVSGFGPKSYEQAAGFLRVRDSDNLLDASAIHPESYQVARALMSRSGIGKDTPPGERETALKALRDQHGMAALASELHTGVPTLQDIFEQLARPGRDPREDAPPPILRGDVMTMDDLQPGMLLSGTVRNVVDFGAFVDIGVKQDGLLHISQIPRNTNLTVGDIIEVKIRNVEKERGRIELGWGS